jgi:hypothetical protein
MSVAKGQGGLQSKVATLKESVKGAVSSVDTKRIDKLGETTKADISNSLESISGNIAGQVEGGVQSLTQEIDGFKDDLSALSTKEGLLDAGAQSLENLKTDIVNGAASAISSKLGANVSIEYTEPDSNGIVYPIQTSLTEQGGLDGTIAAVLTAITGLGSIDAGALQKAVVDAAPTGLMDAASNLSGKIGAFTASSINSLAATAMDTITDELVNSVIPTDINKAISFVSSIDSDGGASEAGVVFNMDNLTGAGPTADSEFNSAINSINAAKTDLETLVTKAKETKQNVEGLKSDLENLSGGKDPVEVQRSSENASLNRQRYSKEVDISNSLVQSRIAKDGKNGIVQSLSTETLTDIKKQVKDFAPSLSPAEIQNVISLSQGDSIDKDEAANILYKRTGKPYPVVKNFLNTIDSTISSATQEPPSEFVFAEPYIIGSYEKEWKKGKGDPVFPYISSTEELQAELRNISREVTEIVVHWTETTTNKNIGSEEINTYHLASNLDGIGYHYVIRRDGSLQRGRPVNIEGQHSPLNNHNTGSIGVVFVGGINVPSGTPNPENFVSVQSLTRSQFNTFDHLCRAFYSTYAGGQIVGHNDIDPNEDDPGFDVREYVLANFGKNSLFTDPTNQSPFTVDEINNDE